MRIDEFDEYQGITREMVDSYLNHKGWCNLPDPEIRLLKPSYVQITFSMGLVRAVEQIAEIERRTVQALLREINPRMRKGRPSDKALDACPYWLVRDIETGECELHNTSLVKSNVPSLRSTPDFADWWEYWPCDANGNKVRWPTDEHGNLL